MKKIRSEIVASIVYAIRQKGGPGSGHFGHAGRPGEVGGSLPSGQSNVSASPTVVSSPRPELYKPFEPAKPNPKRLPDPKTGLSDNPDLYDSLLFDTNEYLVATDQRSDVERERDSLTQFAGKDPESGIRVEIYSIEDNFDDYADEDGNIDYENIDDEGLQWKLYMTAYDKNDKKVGHIEISQTEYGEGYLDFIQLNRAAQKSGFGTRWVEHFEDTMFDRGASVIGLHANIDVGGYYWARIGYDFNDSSTLEYFYESLRDEYNNRYGSDTFVNVDGENEYYDFETLYFQDLFQHSWDIAQFEGPDGFKLGKELMLGSDWHGVKYSWGMEESGGYDIGKAYYDAKRIKST